MMNPVVHAALPSPARLCAPGAPEAVHLETARRPVAMLVRTALILAASSAIYGFSFGFWRDPIQAIFAACKMPVMFLGIVAITGLGNTMIAQILGVEISGRQTLQSMIVSFAITSVVLASLAPVAMFLAVAMTGPADDKYCATYFLLLVLHTCAVAIAGFIGSLRLWHLLRNVAGTFRKAALTMICWTGLNGIVGSEISWICSPFLARPDREIVVINPNAFRMNMYEYLWKILNGEDVR
jgi:hypothetical protein